MIAAELADNADFRKRFKSEAQLAASIDHPNVVPIYETGEADGVLYLAMRYVEGTDLRVARRRRRTGSGPSAPCGSSGRSPARSTPRTAAASCTATSSRRTC